MEIQSEFAIWGVLFAAFMYVIGNGMWVNHLARKKQWMGWLMWAGAAAALLIAGAAIESRLDNSGAGIWQRLTSVDSENHWIALTLLALMSVPGAASVILKQDAYWTRIALIAPAIVVFIPVGMQLGQGGSSLIAGLGLAAAVSAFVLLWQAMLDGEHPA